MLPCGVSRWPTELALPVQGHFSSGDGESRVVQQVLVAVHAIFLDHANARLVHPDDLRLEVKGEHERVARAVHGFKEILAENIIVWDVAIVTTRDARMAATLPCGELRRHYVAIQACARVVREIRSGV